MIRTLLVLLALVGAGIGIRQLVDAPGPPARGTGAAPVSHETSPVPFFLTFSSRPAEVRLETAGSTITLKPEGVTTGGSLALSGATPTVFLSVRWPESDPSLPRFAKLTLEPPSKPTQSHTFDGFGRIDDVWEIHPHR